MEHKGGRIKDHIRREEPQGQDDWIDVEWLDDDEDLDSRPDAASGEQGGAQDKSEEEPFEIEDWRDEENWNLEKKEETPKSEPAKDPSAKRKNTGARSTDGQNPQKTGEKSASERQPQRRQTRAGATGSGQTEEKEIRLSGPPGESSRTCGRKSRKDSRKSSRKGNFHCAEMWMFCRDGCDCSGIVAGILG